MAAGQFCLKWNNFHNSIVSAFESLQSSEELVDVTLMCEGHNVKAHKVILSACSPYFRNLFKETPCQHPIIILKDVLHCDLLAILQFMYQGEVLVEQDGLASFLKTAELLQVSGLAGGNAPSAATGLTESSSTPSKTVPSSAKKENTPSRSPSPELPKPPPLSKHRTTDSSTPTDHVEKENRTAATEVDLEPMQSCSYQTTSSVIIKTEAMDESDFHDMEYNVLHDSLDDPGPTSDEQSILERSLKAQGMSPHSTKQCSMDYPNNAAQIPPDLPPLVLFKTNTELPDKIPGKRKATENAPPAKKTPRAILPKGEFIVVPSPETPQHHGAAQSGKCPHCNKMYSNLSALKYHVRLVHSDMLNMFCCHLCPEYFEFRESYKAHMWDLHNVRN